MQPLTRRGFLRNAGLSSLALGGSELLLRSSGGEKLNVIFILIDDMGWRDLGLVFGSTYYETPNIDKLASQGMRFTNAYAACPVCSPTRASIMTGKYPARLHLTDWIPGRKPWPTSRVVTPEFRHELPLEEITIAEALKPEGYATASIGKWHLGGTNFLPQDQGFDLNVAGSKAGSTRSYFAPYPLENIKGPDGEYITDRLTDEAIKFITSNQHHPFFLYLPHYAVHLPLQAKQKLIEKYQAKAPSQGQSDPVYAAMIDSLDQGVGRLMKSVDDLKLTGKTVVFFMSDNGGVIYEGRSKKPVTSNAPLRAGKGHLYEGGIREPMFVRWPGVVAPGSTCDATVSSVDFYPTILEIAGVRKNPAHDVDGLSLAPLLKKTGSPKREAIYWHYPHYSNQGGVPGGAVRQGDYKLIEFYGDGKLELYNLKNDIGERNNLAQKDPQTAAQLRQMLNAWRKSVNADMPTPNPNYDPAKADQGLTGTEARDEVED